MQPHLRGRHALPEGQDVPKERLCLASRRDEGEKCRQRLVRWSGPAQADTHGEAEVRDAWVG